MVLRWARKLLPNIKIIYVSGGKPEDVENESDSEISLGEVAIFFFLWIIRLYTFSVHFLSATFCNGK